MKYSKIDPEKLATQIRRPVLLTVLLIGAVLVLAGCGGGDGTTSGDGSNQISTPNS
jgi:hypothetical protein